MENRLPKYSKVELLLKTSINNSVPSITKIDFKECWLTVTGDYLIVTIQETIDDQTTNTGRIYSLSEVSAYKTFN